MLPRFEEHEADVIDEAAQSLHGLGQRLEADPTAHIDRDADSTVAGFTQVHDQLREQGRGKIVDAVVACIFEDGKRRYLLPEPDKPESRISCMGAVSEEASLV